MKLIGNEEINTLRQPEADIAKFICLIGLVVVHCFNTFISYSETSSDLQFVIIYILSFIFGAGTFMFCMGIGIEYSSHNSPAQLMKRGLKIFLLGYLLNVFCSLVYLLLNDTASFLWGILGNDIMQFAGLALLLFGFLKYLKLSDLWIGIITLLMSVIGSFVRLVEFDSGLANILLGLFIGTFDYELMTGGIFPLMNWFIFVVAGYFFAKLLRRCENKAKLYLIFSGVSAVILAVYMIIAIPGRLGMMGSVLRYHHIELHEAFVCIAGALFALGVYYALSRIIPEKLQKLITNISRNINTIYCLQWVIIVWTAAFLYITGNDDLSDGALILVGLIIFLISALLAHFYSNFKVRMKTRNKAA